MSVCHLIASLSLSLFSGTIAPHWGSGNAHPPLQSTALLIGHTHISSTHQADAIEEPTDSTGAVEHILHAVIDPSAHFISVKNTLILPGALRESGTEFTLNSALTITSSTPAVKPMGIIESDHGPKRTRYALAADAPAGELVLSYEGVINFGLADEKEQYAKGIRETHGILGPEGIYLTGATAWIPRFGDEMIRFRIEVETPADWHVISQGNGTSDAPGASEGTRRARWDSGADLEQIYLVGGPLVAQSEMADSVEVLVYLHEQDEALSQRYLDATARYIEMYDKLIGPYPYEKFALVENFWETGYGMPSFTLLGRQVIRLPFILYSSYPHEILHNWWGNSVFVDYESGNWCEGLTAYMADHLLQEQRGKGDDYRRGTLQKYRSYVKEGRDFPLSEFRSRHSPATEAIGYGKSLMLFHMLRQEVGDDAFRAAMADFYEKNRGRRASFDDIRRSFESVTGDDFSTFFAQWVEQAGAPSIALRDVDVQGPSASGAYTITGVIEQHQAQGPLNLSIPIVVAVDGGQESFLVKANRRAHTFSLTTQSPPKALRVDPMFDLFRLLDPREIPSSIGQIFGEPRIMAVLPSGEDAQAYRDLMEGWRTDQHDIEIVFDHEIESIPDDRSLWVLGRTNRFAPAALSLDRRVDGDHPVESVDLGDAQIETAGHSVVVIRRHPSNPELGIGWIAVDPAGAFPGFARKLPHYGKYSYLAFEGQGPTNFVKGQWETSESPLIVEFEIGGASLLIDEPRKALAELPPAP